MADPDKDRLRLVRELRDHFAPRLSCGDALERLMSEYQRDPDELVDLLICDWGARPGHDDEDEKGPEDFDTEELLDELQSRGLDFDGVAQALQLRDPRAQEMVRELIARASGRVLP